MELSRRTWLAGLSAPALTIVMGWAMILEAVDFCEEGVIQAASGGASEPGKTATKLRDITEIEELRSAFNAAKGHPRLILLLSPT